MRSVQNKFGDKRPLVLVTINTADNSCFSFDRNNNKPSPRRLANQHRGKKDSFSTTGERSKKNEEIQAELFATQDKIEEISKRLSRKVEEKAELSREVEELGRCKISCDFRPFSPTARVGLDNVVL